MINKSNEIEKKALIEKLKMLSAENDTLKEMRALNSAIVASEENDNDLQKSQEMLDTDEENRGDLEIKNETEYPYIFSIDGNAMYKCDLCSRVYKNKKAVLEHQRQKHFNVPVKPRNRNKEQDKITRKKRDQKRNKQ